jgi:hypothetical protein
MIVALPQPDSPMVRLASEVSYDSDGAKLKLSRMPE